MLWGHKVGTPKFVATDRLQSTKWKCKKGAWGAKRKERVVMEMIFPKISNS